MLIILLLLSLVCKCLASTHCNHTKCEQNSTEVVMSKSDDGVKGRYTLELCGWLPKPAPGTAQWNLLIYADDKSKEACTNYRSNIDHSSIHSAIKKQINITTHCAHECDTVELDLIYTGCYIIKSKYEYENEVDCVLKSYVDSIWVQSEIDDVKYFIDNKSDCDIQSDGNDTIAECNSYRIPITSYDIYLEIVGEGTTVLVNSECSQTSPMKIKCRIRDVPPGNYMFKLQHTAPWAIGEEFQGHSKDCIATNFIHTSSMPSEAHQVSVPSKGGHVALWAGVGGAVLLLLLAVLFTCMRRPARTAILNTWRERYKTMHLDESSKKSRETCRAVVLLYARDCPPFMDAMKHLRACLQDCCTDKVFDLYDPVTQAEIAPSATEWIHGLLQRDDVRVVFVETPVAAEIYNAALLDGEEGLSLRSPLLGSKVLYRAPSPADAQLQYAVRLLKHSAHTQLVYLKYYVASVNTSAEVVPNVAPFRRYVLPGGARLLLEHVAGAPLSPRAPLQALEEALYRYTRHVQDHPDYVRDLLMLLT